MSAPGLSPTLAERRAPPRVAVALTRGRSQREAHRAIRRAVFVGEQGLFAGDDADARDADAATLLGLGRLDGGPAGAVRLYPLDGEGLWCGDRLAVLPAARHTMLGAALVRFAVRTAGERGGHRMVAMIQVPNVQFFAALGWSPDGPVRRFHGIPHQPMAIALSAPGR